MKKIVIELPDNGGYSIKGTDELKDRRMRVGDFRRAAC